MSNTFINSVIFITTSIALGICIGINHSPTISLRKIPMKEKIYPRLDDIGNLEIMFQICENLMVPEIVRLSRVSRYLNYIVNQVSHNFIQTCSTKELGWVPICYPGVKEPPPLLRMYNIQIYRKPLTIDHTSDSIKLSDDRMTITSVPNKDLDKDPNNQGIQSETGFSRCAVNNTVMYAGQHFAQFTILRAKNDISIGLIRPNVDLSYRTGTTFWSRQGIFYNASSGEASNGMGLTRSHNDLCENGYPKNDLVTPAKEGDSIGMLLDFDSRTIKVFKNNKLLGIMLSRPSGVYCWAISMWAGYGEEASVRVDPMARAPTGTLTHGTVS
jgi:hypothetical protein